jgi:hypothetical protein
VSEAKDITILVCCQNVTVHLTGDGGGSIEFPLYEVCDYCGAKDCYGHCPAGQEYASDRDLEQQQSKIEQMEEPKEFNDALEGISSLVLAQAIAGIDITTDAYIESLNTAIEGCANNL